VDILTNYYIPVVMFGISPVYVFNVCIYIFVFMYVRLDSV
jgi:hypothetical protein